MKINRLKVELKFMVIKIGKWFSIGAGGLSKTIQLMSIAMIFLSPAQVLADGTGLSQQGRVQTSAVVTRILSEKRLTSSIITRFDYELMIRFMLADGEWVETALKTHMTGRSLGVSSRLNVWYLADDPTQVQAEDPNRRSRSFPVIRQNSWAMDPSINYIRTDAIVTNVKVLGQTERFCRHGIMYAVDLTYDTEFSRITDFGLHLHLESTVLSKGDRIPIAYPDRNAYGIRILLPDAIERPAPRATEKATPIDGDQYKVPAQVQEIISRTVIGKYPSFEELYHFEVSYTDNQGILRNTDMSAQLRAKRLVKGLWIWVRYSATKPSQPTILFAPPPELSIEGCEA